MLLKVGELRQLSLDVRERAEAKLQAAILSWRHVGDSQGFWSSKVFSKLQTFFFGGFQEIFGLHGGCFQK